MYGCGRGHLELTSIKKFTQGKQINADKFTHNLLVILEASSHAPWVNSVIHANPDYAFVPWLVPLCSSYAAWVPRGSVLCHAVSDKC